MKFTKIYLSIALFFSMVSIGFAQKNSLLPPPLDTQKSIETTKRSKKIIKQNTVKKVSVTRATQQKKKRKKNKFNITFNGQEYYVIGGLWFAIKNKTFELVDAPIGVQLSSLPMNAKEELINGETFYTIAGNRYKRVDGFYKVVAH